MKSKQSKLWEPLGSVVVVDKMINVEAWDYYWPRPADGRSPTYASNDLDTQAKHRRPPEKDWPEMLTREQAAEYLGIRPQTLAIWKLTKRHNLPVVKVGRLCRYRKSDLDNFIRRRTVN